MKYVLLFVDTEEFARDLESMGRPNATRRISGSSSGWQLTPGRSGGEQAAAAGGGDDRAVRSR